MKQRKIVFLEWKDSCHNEGWQKERDSLTDRISHCQSVGFLLRSSKKDVLICQSSSDTGNVSETLCIPRSCIEKITYLKLDLDEELGEGIDK